MTGLHDFYEICADYPNINNRRIFFINILKKSISIGSDVDILNNIRDFCFNRSYKTFLHKLKRHALPPKSF
jgi:hypothetical protein